MTTSDRPRDEHGRFTKGGPNLSESKELAVIHDELATLQTENYKLAETLADVQMMVDVRGWNPIYEAGNDGGLRLGDVKAISKILRELVVGNPLIKQGLRLRSAYVWGGGLQFGAEGGKKLTAEVQATMALPRNQRNLFSAPAWQRMEAAAYTDGSLLTLVDLKSKTAMHLSISEITADFRNPDDSSEIWAYRRVWYKNPEADGISRTETVRWYYTDAFDGTRQSTVPVQGGGREQVDITKTVVGKSFNEQIGWAWGVPDSLPVLAWSKLTKEFLTNGYIMSRALARIAFKITSATAKGGAAASAEVTLPGQAGSAATMGQGADMSAIATAGKGYDFASGRPLAAMMASGLGVSATALLSDNGATTGGAAVNSIFDGMARATAEVRRQEWDEYFARLFKALGNKKVLKITWTDLSDDTIQRLMQAWSIFNASGLFKPEIAQKGMAEVMGILDYGPVPDGYLQPNNEKSLGRKDIDTDGSDAAQGDDQGGASDTGKATGQGTSTGVGKSPNDHSQDDS